jgi:transcriptional regulator with XRE-family HTH domain
MPVRIRALDNARLDARSAVLQLGRDLAAARLTCGTSQAALARALGWSESKVRRIERGQRRSVTHEELSLFASVVGLRYSGRLFVGGARLRDATQVATIDSYRAFARAHGWSCRVEDPIPISGDLRAFDLMLGADGIRVAHEFVSRLRDAQAQVRPMLAKQRDAAVTSLILVLRDTVENRLAVREAGPMLRDVFPLEGRAALQAIRTTSDPGGNAIVFWRASRAR